MHSFERPRAVEESNQVQTQGEGKATGGVLDAKVRGNSVTMEGQKENRGNPSAEERLILKGRGRGKVLFANVKLKSLRVKISGEERVPPPKKSNSRLLLAKNIKPRRTTREGGRNIL